MMNDPTVELLTVETLIWLYEEPVVQRTQELQGHRGQGCSVLVAMATGQYFADVQTRPQQSETDHNNN